MLPILSLIHPPHTYTQEQTYIQLLTPWKLSHLFVKNVFIVYKEYYIST